MPALDYSFRWHNDIKLPEVGTVLPVDDQAAKMIDSLGMTLVYKVPQRVYAGSGPEALLAYQVGSGYPMMLDAATGKALDYRGVELSAVVIKASPKLRARIEKL